VTDASSQTTNLRRPWVLLVIVVVLASAAIGAYVKVLHRSAAAPGRGGATQSAMLSLAGSNTIGSQLAPALAQEFLKDLGATNIKVLPGGAENEIVVQGLLPGSTLPSVIRVAAHGTPTGFDGLADGSCDIAMASRRIKQDEITKLPLMGDMSSPSNEHLLGLDGIAVVVNASNPVRSLTKEQLAGIFAGEVSDWSQVSSHRGSISVYARDEKSGTYDIFKSLVLGDAPLAPAAKRVEDSNALSEAVARDPAGIGFVGFAYIGKARAIPVAEQGTQPMPPNRLTIATEDYPLSRRLYLYTPANPPNDYARQFIQFALSKKGQDVVGNAGFVAQNLGAEQMTTSTNAPAEYKRLTRGAGRLSLDFRFLPGGAVLDNKAIGDINRVIDFIGDLGYGGNNILLFGFSDSSGDQQTNLELAQTRAKIVADELAKRGLKPGLIKGFGPFLPVASNDSPLGREKNRRVEMWLKR
jgi:phosphate transport system substrate-binding protein